MPAKEPEPDPKGKKGGNRGEKGGDCLLITAEKLQLFLFLFFQDLMIRLVHAVLRCHHQVTAGRLKPGLEIHQRVLALAR